VAEVILGFEFFLVFNLPDVLSRYLLLRFTLSFHRCVGLAKPIKTNRDIYKTAREQRRSGGYTRFSWFSLVFNLPNVLSRYLSLRFTLPFHRCDGLAKPIKTNRDTYKTAREQRRSGGYTRFFWFFLIFTKYAPLESPRRAESNRPQIIKKRRKNSLFVGSYIRLGEKSCTLTSRLVFLISINPDFLIFTPLQRRRRTDQNDPNFTRKGAGIVKS
jgi:hypothetical protein